MPEYIVFVHLVPLTYMITDILFISGFYNASYILESPFGR